MSNNILETVEVLKKECEKLLYYYIDIVENPEGSGAEVVISNIETYIDQLPIIYRDSVRDVLSDYLSDKTALGMCYAVFGASNQTSELTVRKILTKLDNDEDDMNCENELVMDSYQEFMQSLLEYTYYNYTFLKEIDVNSLITVILNNMDVIMDARNKYLLDDISVDLDEFIHFALPENRQNESQFYNTFNYDQLFHLHGSRNITDISAYVPTKIWESMLQTFLDATSQLQAIEGFIFTESNREAVCDFIYTSLMQTYYYVTFGVDMSNLNNMEAIECANKMIFKYPAHININNFMNEIKLAVTPFIDLFLRLVLKVTYVANTGFIEYSDQEKIGTILRLKRGFENEIYYNSGNLRKNRVTRRLQDTRVQRDYSRAQQYLHDGKY